MGNGRNVGTESTKKTEQDRRERGQSLEYERKLTERRKELSCVYSIATMQDRFDISIERYFDSVAAKIKESWQYPEITCVRVRFGDVSRATSNFKNTPWQQSVSLFSNGLPDGNITVGYLAKREEEVGGEGPFLKEERALLDALGRVVTDYLQLRQVRIDLRERMKELNCVYKISQMMVRNNIVIGDFFREIVDEIIPNSWQYPNQCAVCIRVQLFSDTRVLEFSNENFQLYPVMRKMVAPIPVPSKGSSSSDEPEQSTATSIERPKFFGEVTVGYVEGAEKKLLFLNEEQQLLDAIANQLSSCVAKFKREKLVHSMLPPHVAENIEHGLSIQPSNFPEVSIMFCDIVGFTSIASRCEPKEICRMLHELYCRFDNIVGNHKETLYKVETIGDAYMVVSGLPETIAGDLTSAAAVFCGLSFIEASEGIFAETREGQKLPIRIRAGVHSGPVVAGVVGHLMPRYCLFGDTVNIASRMESLGVEGRVHMSPSCARQLQSFLNSKGRGSESALHHFLKSAPVECRGTIQVKGNVDMETYFIDGPQAL